MSERRGSQADEPAAILCPVCASALAPEEPIHRCPRCETPAHQDCWTYVGGCAIFGCASTPNSAKAPGHDLVPRESLGNQVDLGATGVLLSLYFWILRLHWWSFAGMNLGFASLVPVALLQPVGEGLMLLTGLMIWASLTGYLLLTIPLLVLRSLLEFRLALSFKPGKGALRGVLDRIEFAPAESLAKRIATASPRVYLAACGIGLVWISLWLSGQGHQGFLPGTVVGAALASVFGYLPIAFLRQGTEDRLAFVATLQNRMIASTKGTALLPG